METASYIINDQPCTFWGITATVYKSGIKRAMRTPGGLYCFIMDISLHFESEDDGNGIFLEYEIEVPITYADRDFGRANDAEIIAEDLINQAAQELTEEGIFTPEIEEELNSWKDIIKRDIEKYLED